MKRRNTGAFLPPDVWDYYENIPRTDEEIRAIEQAVGNGYEYDIWHEFVPEADAALWSKYGAAYLAECRRLGIEPTTKGPDHRKKRSAIIERGRDR